MLVHVYDPGLSDEGTVLRTTERGQQRRRLAEKAMQVIVAQLGSPDVRTEVRVGGDIPGKICEVAQDRDADLLMVGTLGHTGVARFFLGSVAERVMRRAHCPVWVERPGGPEHHDVERIVVCTDLSPLSEAGLALASALASDLEAAVELVYALEPPYAGLSVDVRREAIKSVRGELAELAARHFTGTTPRLTIVEGANVVDGITAHASRTAPDLLVLSTHGRTGLSRAFMGSVSERVARFAPCSVLVARSPVEVAAQ